MDPVLTINVKIIFLSYISIYAHLKIWSDVIKMRAFAFLHWLAFALDWVVKTIRHIIVSISAPPCAIVRLVSSWTGCICMRHVAPHHPLGVYKTDMIAVNWNVTVPENPAPTSLKIVEKRNCSRTHDSCFLTLQAEWDPRQAIISNRPAHMTVMWSMLHSWHNCRRIFLLAFHGYFHTAAYVNCACGEISKSWRTSSEFLQNIWKRATFGDSLQH